MTKRLLIVEDDPGLQSQMRWCFSDDLEVTLAADRESALTALRRLEPEVITVDLGLPPRRRRRKRGFPAYRRYPQAGTDGQNHRRHRP